MLNEYKLGDRDIHYAGLQPGHFFDGGNGVFQRVQHLNDVLKEKVSVPVQSDSALAAFKELNADIALQLGDRSAQSGLGDVQFLGGQREAFMLGNGLKIVQLSDLHNV